MNWIEQLSDRLDTWQQATGIAAEIYDEEFQSIRRFGPEYSYCTLFQQETEPYCPCGKTHVHTCRLTKQLGAGYISTCPAGYVHFSVCVYSGRTLSGYVLAGPIALDFADLDQIDSVIEQFGLSLNLRSKLYGAYRTAPLIEPRQAHYYCKLLEDLTAMPEPADTAPVQKDVPDTKVQEFARLVSSTEPMFATQYEREQQFIALVLAGDMNKAKTQLNDMLGGIYFASGNNLEIIRTRSIELMTLLSRAIIENGGSQLEVYQKTDAALHRILDVSDLEALSYSLLEILDEFFSIAFARYPVQNVPVMKRALDYISEHYAEPLSLNIVADEVGLNPTYFSALFIRKMNVSFSEYLTNTRITQAKRLLKKSTLPIVEVALRTGFSNQSYFTKVFKKEVGMTPRQYRCSE